MPMLLEDLAEETSASIRRAADRLAAEAERLGESRPAPGGDPARMSASSARHACGYAVSLLPQAENVWRSALDALRAEPAGENAVRLLQSLLGAFEAGERLCQASGDLWGIAEALGAAAEPTGELDQARRRFAALAAEVRRALDHREREWRPADPDRFALGLQQSREGKTVSADQARAWFRR